MLDDTYLEKGVTALARAVDHAWPQGHFGCACVATYFLCADPSLDPASAEALRVELDKMIASRAHLFVPMDLTGGRVENLEEVLSAFEIGIGKLVNGGHNAIYAGLAVKALRHNPGMATQEAVQGIARLLEVTGSLPARTDIQGVDASGLTPDMDDTVPRYVDDETIAEFTFREILRFDPMYHEIQGYVGHLVTHAQALVTLSRLGYEELARRAHDAHRLHARQVRFCHDRFNKSYWTVVTPTHSDPLDPAFWADRVEAMAKDSWGFGHFFKYRYQFYDLLALVRDPELKQECLRRMPEYLMNDFRNRGRRPEEFYIPIRTRA